MKPKKHIILALIVFLAGIALIAAAFAVPGLIDKKMDRNNRKALEAVVKQVFTCPNTELTGLYADMYEEAISNVSASDEQFIEFSSLRIEDYLKEYYSPYFTDIGYSNFKQSFLISSNIYSTALGYLTTVDKVEISRSSAIKTNYSFRVYLRHGEEDGYMGTTVVEGNAQFYEEQGKLSYINFFDKELMHKLWDKRPGI